LTAMSDFENALPNCPHRRSILLACRKRLELPCAGKQRLNVGEYYPCRARDWKIFFDPTSFDWGAFPDFGVHVLLV